MKYFEIEEKEENLIISENKNSVSRFTFQNTIHVLGLIGHMDAIIKYLKLNNNYTK